jgi:hypothetical protein
MLAVLELNSFLEGTEKVNVPAAFFSDLVRGYSHEEAPKLRLMTKENILLLLPNGQTDLANCEAGCEVETGRRLGADLIITGELRRVGNLNLLEKKSILTESQRRASSLFANKYASPGQRADR